MGLFFARGPGRPEDVKRTAAALIAIALPCLAADRIVELRFGSSGTNYVVPSGKLFTLIGRSWSTGQGSPTIGYEREGFASGTFDNLDEIGRTFPSGTTLTVRRGISPSTGWVLFREWDPTPAPSDTLPVVPAGSGAVLTLETSSDLTAWQPALRTNLPAVTTNRFFRLRLERAE